MIEKEKPAVIDAADKLNDVIEALALKAAGTKGDGDPEHVAGTTNEQVYVPEANELPTQDPGLAGMPLLKRPHRKRSKQNKS